MKDDRCVRFLQWALPQMHMRWPGFRKVRRQVCKRIDRRMKMLGLTRIDIQAIVRVIKLSQHRARFHRITNTHIQGTQLSGNAKGQQCAVPRFDTAGKARRLTG